MVTTTSQVGSLTLPSPLLPASGCAGHSDELAEYLDFEKLGAFLPKGLRHDEWPGNPEPRVAELPAGMMNSIGFGPSVGLQEWLDTDLPKILKHTDRVVVAIWGQTVAEYEKAASMLANAPKEVIAVEVNVSCPNTDDANKMFAASAVATSDVVQAASACNRPMWVKLSPAVPNIVEIAGAAYQAGAETVVLSNTFPGMKLDIEKRQYALGAGSRGGGVSGVGLHPVAVKLVHDVRAAFPEKGIVGIGGVSTGEDVVEFLMAGADAVGIGTALFYDPHIISDIHAQLVSWCAKHNVDSIDQLIGVIHDNNGR